MKKNLFLLVFLCLVIGGIFAQQLDLDVVIKQSARAVENVLRQGTKVAVLNFASPSETFSDYVIEELTGELVTGQKVTIVDRRNLALITSEMHLQLSGDVSDESAQAIGRMLGAQSIVSGTLTNMGTFHRFRIRVINVETAAIQTQVSLDLQNNAQVSFLLGGTPAAAGRGQAAPAASAVQTPAPTAPVQLERARDGTYTFRPRLRANQAGIPRNLYLDRIVIHGQFFTVFFTGTPSGRGGDGEYHNFWNDHHVISLQNLDSSRRSFNPINQGDREEVTGGFYLIFQGVTGIRFSLISTKVNPPWSFGEIVLGEPD